MSQPKIPKLVKITPSQMQAIVNARDTLSGMIGVGSDFDSEAKRMVKSIDKFLNSNGLKSQFS